MKKYIIIPLVILITLILNGCTPPPPPTPTEVDVSKATCDDIDTYRQITADEYRTKLEAISDAFWATRRQLDQKLHECMVNAWNGNVCDEEWAALEEATRQVWTDVSNDDLYNNYKAKQAEWKACSDNFDEEYKKYEEECRQKEEVCQQDFQAKVDSAIATRQAEEASARAKKDSDLTALDALEERCKKQEEDRLAQIAADAEEARRRAEARARATTAQQPNAPQCGTIPGENGTPRPGRAPDLGAGDVAVDSTIRIAEGVTGTPIPIGAINDRIFAGVVCTKLYARILELRMEEIDALGNRCEEIRLRRLLIRYERAKQMWCSIAQGKTTVTEVRTQTEEIRSMGNTMEELFIDENCTDAVCCSESTMGSWNCTADGICDPVQVQAPEGQICAGSPAVFISTPQTVETIFYEGRLLPTSGLQKCNQCEGCDGEHWHAFSPVTALNDTIIQPNDAVCGLGKVSDLPIVKAEVMSKSK